jgi:O-antigen ligase
VIAVTFLVVTFVKPAWGLAAALAAVCAESFGLSVGGVSPSEAALAFVGLAWFFRALIRPETVAKPHLRDAPVLILIAVITIGIAGAQDPAPIAHVFIFWTLFYCVYLQVQTFTPKEMRLVVVALVCGAAVLGAIGAIDYLRSGNQGLFAGGELTGARAASAFADPNYYAALLVLAILPGIAITLSDARRNSWLAVACALTFAGLALSLSRGGLVAFFGAALLLLAWQRARWVAVGLATLFAVFTFANANPLVESQQFNVVQQRLSTLSGPGLEQRSRRPAIWRVAREVAAAHPFFGVGVNQFQFEAARWGLTERGVPLENAHSVVFSLAAETGLIGLAAFLFFLGQLGVRAVRAMQTSDRLRYALALGGAAALVGFAIQGLTVVQIRVSIVAGILFVIGGMITGLADRVAAEAREANP